MKKTKMPMYSSHVQAGFPSPADDHVENKLDLNELLIKRPASTFFVRVEGDSMKDIRIHQGDILIVDRSLTPVSGSVVIAVLNGEMTVKKIRRTKTKLFLVPENDSYPEIEVKEDEEFTIWGVVTNVIHNL
ncbi:MAG: translesion error-prone DNA polymerase V autoproteolytic subunit [Candidatus Omnitrophica bacterium]|nr:translesion error-prone DNA polymerase V autoproteolytic subunit [Candidatus Omnitrophota bacterium]